MEIALMIVSLIAFLELLVILKPRKKEKGLRFKVDYHSIRLYCNGRKVAETRYGHTSTIPENKDKLLKEFRIVQQIYKEVRERGQPYEYEWPKKEK